MSKSAKGRVKCTPTKCRQYLRLILANVFSNVGLCGLVVGYAIIGALTFESLEANQESHMKEEIKQLREKCVQKLWNATLKYNVLFEPNWTREARETLKEFEQKVAGAAKTEGYDGKGTDKELQWSFSGALLYSVTVITTIGYGNIAPKTWAGKVVTIIYALLGVPLMLLCLTNIGDLLAHAFKFAYSRICCIMCEDKRKYRPQRMIHCDGSVKYVAHVQVTGTKSLPTVVQPGTTSVALSSEKQPPLASIDVINEGSETESTTSATKLQGANQSPPRNLSPSSVTTTTTTSGGVSSTTHRPSSSPNSAKGAHSERCGDIVSDHAQDSEMVSIERVPQLEDADARVPINLVFAFVSCYICMGATIFSLWENWTFLNGAYFCFITLTTIGFGDLVPGTSILDTNSESGQAKLIICCIYLIMGLAIIAMSFNLVQEEVTAKCKLIGRNLGILEDEDND